jgi:hypothetical protein
LEQRRIYLFEMMRVVGCDFVEFLLQSPDAGFAVDELEMAMLFIVKAGVMNDCATGGLVYVSREFQRQLRIIKLFRPRILIESPYDGSAFAKDSADAVEQDRLGIGKVMEDEPDRPLVRRVAARQLRLTELKEPQRFISRRFESLDYLHAIPQPRTCSSGY